jgi:hypothetical protein
MIARSICTTESGPYLQAQRQTFFLENKAAGLQRHTYKCEFRSTYFEAFPAAGEFL